MVEETQKDEAYWKKVSKVYRAVGCSHHPQNAVDLVQENDWSVTDGITPDYFVEDNSFGIVSPKMLEKLSPRQRFAYETVRRSFWFAPGNSFFLGRAVRNGFSFPEDDAPLDDKVMDNTAYGCAQFSAQKAYAVEFPFSATLDKVVGGLAGLAVAPVGFVAGLLYTPRKNLEQTESYATTK